MKNIKKNRKFFSLVLAIAMILSLVACGGSSSSSDSGSAGSSDGDKPTIAFLVQHTAQKRWNSADIPSFEKRAAELGYEAYVQSAEDNSENQIKQAEIAIMKGVSAIILNPVNFKAGDGIVKMAAEEGIPVIAYNDILENSEIDGFCGRNSKVLGLMHAEEMVKLYPSGNYIIVGGDESQAVPREMIEGYKEVLANHPNITVVSDQYNKEWSPESALKQVEGALLANEDNIQAVLCNNDGMAVGVNQALESVGLSGKVGISGQDADTAALQMINEGNMSFTVFTEFSQMAIDAVNLADALIKGTELPEHSIVDNGSGKEIPWIETQMVLINKDNVEEFVDSHTWWVTREEVFG